MHPDAFLRTLLLTSPGSAEGKSFIVANLATVLASGGNRVVVVDADMRRPAQHEFFDRPNIVGLADVLSDHSSEGEDSSDTIPLQKTDFGNLSLLSSGRPPTDPAALLTSTDFASLLERLQTEADVILIDGPPLLGPPDATIIAAQVEGTILVVSTGLTRRDSGRKARDHLLAQQGATLLGLAVNQVKARGSYYYYYHTSDREIDRPWWKWWERDREDGALTLAEAASRLGISKRQARRWCKSGRLSARRDRLLWWWRVDRAALDRVVRETVGNRMDETPNADEQPSSEML
jgi:capsular exopolysaccharide synthesis family protein